LHAPNSFPFSCDRPSGATRVVPTGPDFDVRPGGVICAALVDLPLGISLSGCYNAALASVALLSGARACWAFWAPRAIASWSFAAFATMSTTGRGCGAVCGVARAPVLRALVRASGAASLAMAPELVIGEEALKSAGSGGLLNECEG
jgi:hypothetical protein